ncbi:MAG: hypothetical protein A2Y31_03580 [Spirochaetes bacterium GWC2_52_13]|nr:MAG: hypothetical protein A2Y31_03580 [Spirochaetes bacterium GWC2_52_13]
MPPFFSTPFRADPGSRRESPGDEETIVPQIFADFYREELSLYTPGHIVNCCRLLLVRSLEEV